MVEINNLTAYVLDQNLLEKTAKKVLKEEGREKENLSLVFVGQTRMQKLNEQYLLKKRSTDVLAFPLRRTEKERFAAPSEKTLILGEIIICPEEIKKNVKMFNSSFNKEVSLCLIHGLLHLLGYNHEKNRHAAARMEKKQNYYLKQIFK